MDVLGALVRTLELVRVSEESIWTNTSKSRIETVLSDAIMALGKGDTIDSRDLQFLFLPTGAIQETAVDNGWGGEFLALAESVDDYFGSN